VLPQIIRTLQDAGVQIKRFEVTLTEQPEQQPSRDQLLQDGLFQQRGSTGGSSPDGRFANEWLTEDSSYQDITEPQLLFAGESINMLI